MKKEKMLISAPQTTVDAEGFGAQAWGPGVVVAGVLLPIGQELASKEYGYDAPVKYRAFTKIRSPAIKIGNRVSVRGCELFVVHIADYGKMQDVLLNDEIKAGGNIGAS